MGMVNWKTGLLILALALGPACSSQVPPRVSGTGAEPADLEAEEARLREALEVSPGDPDLTFSLARVLAEQERTEESLELFAETLELDPGMKTPVNRERRLFLEAYQNQAEALLEDGRNTKAGEILERAELMFPADGRTAYLRGRVFQGSGDLPQAVVSFRSALDADHGNREYQESLVSCLLALGQRDYEKGRFASAAGYLEEAEIIRSGPDLQYLKGMVAYAWAGKSEEPERSERLAAAADCFRRVLEKDPRDEDARFNLGAVLLAAERYPEAAEVYRELIGENPEDGRLYLALSRAHSLSGESEVAMTEDAIGRSLRSGEHVDNPETWSYRAAERFPQTALAETYAEYGDPEAVITYTVPGGGLVEVWFYWKRGIIQAFREGGEVGSPFFLDR